MKVLKSKDGQRADVPFLIEEDDIFSNLEHKQGSSLFMGKYSLSELITVLKKKNLFRIAQQRGLWPLIFAADSSEFPPLQRFQVFLKNKQPENLIVDLKIREGKFRPKPEIEFPFSMDPYNFLMLEWLTLQNPLIDFTEKKTPLPGQQHPGLNIGNKIINLFVMLAQSCQDDGILAFPAYYHNALLFSRKFHFVNPVKKGEVLAIRKSYPNLSFKKMAWVVHLNCLRNEDGSVYEWKAEEQLYPLNKRLEGYFEDREYKNLVKKSENSRRFFIDWNCYEEKIAEIKDKNWSEFS